MRLSGGNRISGWSRVARQYCGELGKVENGQVMVSLSGANDVAGLPVAARLYRPKDWIDNDGGAAARTRGGRRRRIPRRQCAGGGQILPRADRSPALAAAVAEPIGGAGDVSPLAVRAIPPHQDSLPAAGRSGNPTGGGVAIPTLPPYVAVNYIIGVQGIHPDRD